MTESTSSENDAVGKLFDLTGKVALITGGSGYLGSSFARILAEAGAGVVVGSRSEETAQRVASELPSPGGATHHGVSLDQLDEVGDHEPTQGLSRPPPDVSLAPIRGLGNQTLCPMGVGDTCAANTEGADSFGAFRCGCGARRHAIAFSEVRVQSTTRLMVP